MNSVSLIGRLTDTVKISKSQSGKIVARFTLAVQKRGQRDEANFIDCTAFEGTADILQRFTKKGSQIGVNGYIDTSVYDDVNYPGRKVKSTKVIVIEITLLGSRETPQETSNCVEEIEINPDDLPF